MACFWAQTGGEESVNSALCSAKTAALNGLNVHESAASQSAGSALLPGARGAVDLATEWTESSRRDLSYPPPLGLVVL